MSFKGFDKQSYIVDSAKAFGSRKISKREFMRRICPPLPNALERPWVVAGIRVGPNREHDRRL